ncbi:MAG: type VI secretion system ATPase TssH, partial [Chloroflexota bacterium]|nr:type VI secretion system ATPase TssH [Chloroflexota bacterium]
MASNHNYTDKARRAIVAGQQLTQQKSLAQYEPEALLVSLIDQQDGIVPQILQRLDVEPSKVLSEGNGLVDRAPKLQFSAEAVVSSSLRQALQVAESEAAQFGDEYLSTEHLFLGILAGERTPSASLLARHGISKDRVYGALTEIRGNQRVTNENPETTYQA